MILDDLSQVQPKSESSKPINQASDKSPRKRLRRAANCQPRLKTPPQANNLRKTIPRKGAIGIIKECKLIGPIIN